MVSDTCSPASLLARVRVARRESRRSAASRRRWKTCSWRLTREADRASGNIGPTRSGLPYRRHQCPPNRVEPAAPPAARATAATLRRRRSPLPAAARLRDAAGDASDARPTACPGHHGQRVRPHPAATVDAVLHARRAGDADDHLRLRDRTQIEHIPLVVFDQDGRAEGRRLIEAFVNTRRFEIDDRVFDDESFHRALTSGRARVGLRSPAGLLGSIAARRTGECAGADRWQRLAGGHDRAQCRQAAGHPAVDSVGAAARRSGALRSLARSEPATAGHADRRAARACSTTPTSKAPTSSCRD